MFPKLPDDREFDIKKHSIMIGLGGSKSYGTNNENSDTDWKGVLVPPRKFHMTSLYNFEQTSWKFGEDTGRKSEIAGLAEKDEEGTIFGLDKFIKLCVDSNPNVIELLYLDPSHYVQLTEEGKLLIDNRNLFLSQRALYSFSGYAISQLKRIKTHKSWIDNPPDHSPTREEYGLSERKLIPVEQINASRKLIINNLNEFAPWLLEVENEHKEAFYEGIYSVLAIIAKEKNIPLDSAEDWISIEGVATDSISKLIGYDDNFMQYLKMEKEYATSKRHYDQYVSWKKNRNPARADIETKYGYDTKHAMHLVRLLRMAEEIITTGTMNVYRPDRDELVKIRNGLFSYDYLIEYSEETVDRLTNIVRSGKSAVRKTPDIDRISDISLYIKDSVYKRLGV
jgi:uncharacterized protein